MTDHCGVANLVRQSHYSVVDWDLGSVFSAKIGLTMKGLIGSPLVVTTRVVVLVSGRTTKLAMIHYEQLPSVECQ